jgi:hypothetical protein
MGVLEVSNNPVRNLRKYGGGCAVLTVSVVLAAFFVDQSAGFALSGIVVAAAILVILSLFPRRHR